MRCGHGWIAWQAPRSSVAVTALAMLVVGCGWAPAETAAVDDTVVVGAEVVRVDVLANDRVSEGDEVAVLRVLGGPAGVEVDGLVLLVGPFGALERTSFDYELETVGGDRSSATVRVTEGATRGAPPDDEPPDDQPPPREEPPEDDPPPPQSVRPDLVVELEQLGPAPDDAVEYRAVVSNVGPGGSPPVQVAVVAGEATSVAEIPGLASGEIFGLGGVLDTNPAPGIELVAEVDIQDAATETDEGNNLTAIPIDYLPRGIVLGPNVLDWSSGGWEYEYSVADVHDPDGGSVTVAWTFVGGGFTEHDAPVDGSVLVYGDSSDCTELVATAEFVDDEGNSVAVTTSFEHEFCP